MVKIPFAGLFLLLVFSACQSNSKAPNHWLDWCEKTHHSDSILPIEDVASMRESFVQAYNQQLLHRLEMEASGSENYREWIESGNLGLSISEDTLYQRFNGDLNQPYAIITYPFQTDSTAMSLLESCFYSSIDHLFAAWVIEQENGDYKIETDYLVRSDD